MRLTANRLNKLGACSTHEFEEVFPDGAELTKANVRKAQRAGLNVLWLRGLLKPEPTDCVPGQCNICDENALIFKRFSRTKLFAKIKAITRNVRA